MRSCRLKWISIVTSLFLLLAVTGVWAHEISRYGMRGNKVYELQSRLYKLHYLAVSPTGYFGKQTVLAVNQFQRENGLVVDGIVGSKTNRRLTELAKRQSGGSRSRWSDLVQALRWSDVDRLWKRDAIAQITDIQTGKIFWVKRFGGDLHCDTEPLTRSDTQIMHQIVGGKWSWQRRAVIVELDGYRIAGSMNGYPHGSARIGENEFQGHFCIHFLGSRVHQSHRVDPEHQKMIWQAMNFQAKSAIEPVDSEGKVEQQENSWVAPE